MAAGSTYTPIATTTLGSAAASYTFSSISGSYTDLILITNVKNVTAAAEVRFQVNGDTATNYSYTYLSGNGTSAFSGRGTSADHIPCNAYADASTTFAQTTSTHFQNYSNTTTYKTFLDRASNANNGVDAIVGLWRSTAAITSIKVYLGTGANMDTGSTFTLYGISAA